MAQVSPHFLTFGKKILNLFSFCWFFFFHFEEENGTKKGGAMGEYRGVREVGLAREFQRQEKSCHQGMSLYLLVPILSIYL